MTVKVLFSHDDPLATGDTAMPVLYAVLEALAGAAFITLRRKQNVK